MNMANDKVVFSTLGKNECPQAGATLLNVRFNSQGEVVDVFVLKSCGDPERDRLALEEANRYHNTEELMSKIRWSDRD